MLHSCNALPGTASSGLEYLTYLAVNHQHHPPNQGHCFAPLTTTNKLAQHVFFSKKNTSDQVFHQALRVDFRVLEGLVNNMSMLITLFHMSRIGRDIPPSPVQPHQSRSPWGGSWKTAMTTSSLPLTLPTQLNHASTVSNFLILPFTILWMQICRWNNLFIV